MIIKPKIRGFICINAHPKGCAAKVDQEINYVKSQGSIANGPKNVLVIGASSGYGLSSRIVAGFGCNASTIGVFFEKPGSEKKSGTAGYYNAAAFDKRAKEEGLYAKSINGDAFSNEVKQKVIDIIKQDLEQIDLVVYSLASPVRKLPDTQELVRSAIKPIGETFKATAVDTDKNKLFDAEIEPANEQEIKDTVTVMGGQDWELWMNALEQAGVLSDNCRSVSYSYIGTEITWPIYWNGTLGKAKADLERAASAINGQLAKRNGSANVAVLKSVVTQASSAIPVMPLYISLAFKLMKDHGTHEGCIEQVDRLFRSKMYCPQNTAETLTDEHNRYRLDDWELREDIQSECKRIWSLVTDENLFELSDLQGYKTEFLRLFGFEVDGVNYDNDTSYEVSFDVEKV